MEDAGKPRILLVEDDPDLAMVLLELLQAHGYAPLHVTGVAPALAALAQVPCDAVITELVLPDLDGFELLATVRAQRPSLPVLTLSALCDCLEAAIPAGATGALQKPFDVDAFLTAVRSLLEGRAIPAAPWDGEKLEASRLEAFHRLGLGELEPSEGMVRFVERVGRLFRMPLCLVSLVDDRRQRWLCSWGLPDDLEAKGALPREESFCTHVVTARAPLVLQDALRNPCFKTHRMVQLRGVRFYAGMPLYTRGGHALGTLCVMDFAPHRFGHFDRALLRLLATRVAGELEWQARLLTAQEPESSFRYLSRFDPELDLLGREAFVEALELQTSRALVGGLKLTLLAARLEAANRRPEALALERAFPAELIGRLERDEVGVLALGLEPEEAGAKLQAAVPGAPWVALELSRRVSGAAEGLHAAEVQLAER